MQQVVPLLQLAVRVCLRDQDDGRRASAILPASCLVGLFGVLDDFDLTL